MYEYNEFEDEQNLEYSDDLYNDDEELDFSHKDSNDILDLNELPDEISIVEVAQDINSITSLLRTELKKKIESSRKKFKVLHNGKTYTCPPVSELKSGKFIFDICGKLTAVPLSDIKV